MPTLFHTVSLSHPSPPSRTLQFFILSHEVSYNWGEDKQTTLLVLPFPKAKAYSMDLRNNFLLKMVFKKEKFKKIIFSRTISSQQTAITLYNITTDNKNLKKKTGFFCTEKFKVWLEFFSLT